MEILKKSSDAYLQKMMSVYAFQEYYTNAACLINEAVLEDYDETNKRFVLVRVFVETVDQQQPYVIFINQHEKMVSIDLISSPTSLEKIIEKHEKIAPKHSLFGTGSLTTKNKEIFVKSNQNDDLAAALLWSVNSQVNLSPKIGLEIVKEFLNPIC
jgi:hypothetical protein